MTREQHFHNPPLQDDMASGVAESDSIPPLLRLPAELRDEIYRLATLMAPETWALAMTFNKCPDEPPLLFVNRQIRAEASSIYYKQNNFIFQIRNLDARTYISWCQASLTQRLTANVRLNLIYEPLLQHPEHFRDPLSGPGQKVFVPEERQLWPNLMFWLENYYLRRCLGVPNVEKDYLGAAFSNTAAALFDTVGRLGKGHNMSWEQVKDVLEPMQRALGSANSAWLGFIKYD
ncbi:hypothetical protein CKM354_000748300 [Cercospora kikuchii]|uniref:F-box domain-containing protein n=1 Tax=Cercospora kikuchii TaxID=84275 RepID=A0A9P3FJ52_9PEZI|nr:uncharacterized protein CKM354_000748300 [Cercospora kikuchii]GIZ44280.1 hypothetical protein CKM354_000748300 [Cercospora kikuchii]